jgi:hypothetical protein
MTKPDQPFIPSASSMCLVCVCAWLSIDRYLCHQIYRSGKFGNLPIIKIRNDSFSCDSIGLCKIDYSWTDCIACSGLNVNHSAEKSVYAFMFKFHGMGADSIRPRRVQEEFVNVYAAKNCSHGTDIQRGLLPSINLFRGSNTLHKFIQRSLIPFINLFRGV